ncbi:MAG: TRAP transporter small permease subunit [Proteobacteria bacterium]|nr:TRAP transporter small permease subunit [Pseudomonadota bacterium]
MQGVARVLSIVFGVMMLALSAAIAVEATIRKLFSVSLGGIDELSGYAIAIGGPIAFAVTLIDRSHIRINLLHMRMPLAPRAIVNALSALTLAVLAVALLAFSVATVLDTRLYGSIAQTPWATPLIYPQTLWLAAMAIFAAVALWLTVRAAVLVARADWQSLDRDYAPETAADELKAELDDLDRR